MEMVDGNRIKERLVKLRKKLVEKNMGAAFITKAESYMYLSGFTGTSAALVITQERAFLITDFRYMEQASEEAPLFEKVENKGSFILCINEILKENKVRSLGFEESHLTFAKYSEYKAMFDIEDFVPLEGTIEKLRVIKDDEEIARIRHAVEIADNAFAQVLKVIRPGVKEIEIAAELEYIMKKQGAKGSSFDTIVASGKRAAMPHGVASEKKVSMGDVITLDFGAIFENYCSDMTRTVFLGEPPLEMKKIYKIVLEAQMKALEGAKKGLYGKGIDFIARDIIGKHGYAKNFGHGLGHGVGLEVHEEPRLSPSGNMAVENGMVVTIEPGIYIPDLGGVRIEDIIVIQEDQPKVLTQSTKEMIIL